LRHFIDPVNGENGVRLE